MQRLMVRLGRWTSGAICSVVASVFLTASVTQGLPIDLTNSRPTVTSATTLHIDGIATLGSRYWADFKWNSNTNKFDVTAYGEHGGSWPSGEFVLIDPGSFTMGAPTAELGREPNEVQHDVTLTDGFYLAETEVTQAQWEAVMGTNPSHFSGCDDCPVEWVSWHDAVDYCNALSALEGLEPAYEVKCPYVNWDQSANGYRLPTEAEWEYACRAGSTTAFYNGGITETQCSDPNLDQIGWYCGNSAWTTHEVGQKLPNAWGLYDMSGNVYEWCWDWRGDYPLGPVTDPVGPSSGNMRVMRGGSWGYTALQCRSAYRAQVPDIDGRTVGLRPARATP